VTFRLRVLALVVVVAVAATLATLGVTVRQASRQITELVAADERAAAQITDQLTRYARMHGTWTGVADDVRRLAEGTQLRIRMVTVDGTLVADSDPLARQATGPIPTVPVVIDPRPRLSLGEVAHPPSTAKIVATLIAGYRTSLEYAACLTRAGVRVVPVISSEVRLSSFATASIGAEHLALPEFRADPGSAEGLGRRARACEEAESARRTSHRARDETPPTQACTRVASKSVRACLQRVFRERVGASAAPPARLWLVASDQRDAQGFAMAPVVTAAGLVAVLVLAGTLALSRQVLRPVGTLTTAVRRFGSGDLAQRVPVTGGDELGELGRSFNRMADSLQRAEEAQRRMVADIAHELRTPLANLRGYLEALKDGVLRPDQALFASLLEEAVLQQRIVDDLHELALAEAGTLAYHRMLVDVAELMETCRTTHQAAASAAGVELHLDLPREPGVLRVDADPDRLRQVLGNLLINALCATPAGGSITLGVRPVGDQVRLSVADTGSGIAAADLPFLFDRFWRADASRTRGTGGSGLGLAIARQIILDHNGTVDVASTVGAGTTFTIQLPAVQAVSP
jgi:two-component system, OmpR family, sensor histidine kinase BaeS